MIKMIKINKTNKLLMKKPAKIFLSRVEKIKKYFLEIIFLKCQKKMKLLKFQLN